MKKIIIILIYFSCYQTSQAYIGGVQAQNIIEENAKATAMIQSTNNATSTTSSSSSNCNCPPTTTSNVALPPLSISLYNASGTVINTYNFATDPAFMSSTAILSVHIFPPSNSISSKISYLNKTDSYAIVYTLRSTNGTYLQKSMQYAVPVSNTTPNTFTIGNQIPVGIAINMSTTTSGSSNPTITPLLSPSPVNFLPTAISAHQTTTQQRIFNGICPMSQKFLISNTGNSTAPSATAIPISGMFDSSDDSTLQSSFLNSAVSTPPTSSGNPLQTFTVQLSDGSNSQSFKFGGTSSMFNQQDLTNGLSLNIHMFPASSGVTATSNSYILIATLKSLDGLKFHKQILSAQTSTSVTFSPAPTQFTITDASGNTAIATILFNSAISNQALNIISPTNIRCMLQAGSGGTINVTML